jgi:hypothetical protein
MHTGCLVACEAMAVTFAEGKLHGNGTSTLLVSAFTAALCHVRSTNPYLAKKADPFCSVQYTSMDPHTDMGHACIPSMCLARIKHVHLWCCLLQD